MKIFLFLLALYAFNSLACEYIGQDGILVTKKEIKKKDLKLKLKDCTARELETIRSTFSNIEGNIGILQLHQILAIPHFKMNHDRLIIKKLSKMTKQQLALKDNMQVYATTTAPSIMGFNSTDSLSLFCNSCLYGSDQNLSLHIKSASGELSKEDIKVNFVTYFTAYRILSNTAAFSGIKLDDVEVIMTENIPHIEFLTDVSQLRFYQTNKSLKAGQMLKMSDLSPTRIIHAGVKSEVILENHFIKIKTYGIPRSAGSIGEMIEVYHPEKNKKYYGKVIDINKVHVQL